MQFKVITEKRFKALWEGATTQKSKDRIATYRQLATNCWAVKRCSVEKRNKAKKLYALIQNIQVLDELLFHNLTPERRSILKLQHTEKLSEIKQLADDLDLTVEQGALTHIIAKNQAQIL